jgi:hypothetical protein
MLGLSALPGEFSICRLDPSTHLPASLSTNTREFLSITRAADEISIVCRPELVPADCIAREDHFRALKIEGPLDFALSGILSSILAPLAASQISVFTISTFNTDYIFVRSSDLARATEVLESSQTARVRVVG